MSETSQDSGEDLFLRDASASPGPRRLCDRSASAHRCSPLQGAQSALRKESAGTKSNGVIVVLVPQRVRSTQRPGVVVGRRPVERAGREELSTIVASTVTDDTFHNNEVWVQT